MNQQDAIDFTRPWEYSDVIFAVEGKRVYASKMILSMWSPVIKAMLSRDFREKTANEIPLPGKTADAIVELMLVLHPPTKEVDDDNVEVILPLAHEYQIEKVLDRCESVLISQASSVKNFNLAQKYNLRKLLDSNLSYIKRTPVSKLKCAPDFDSLDRELVISVLMEKCEKLESNLEGLREVRMVLERKKPTMFPGMHLLCEECTNAREQQVDCMGCMKSCCKKITDIIRNMER